ncbi:glycoside hydrolase family 19 protein [Pseudoxanthomonas winnipegensis]|nr:glycoside hydrolase family 19 protein [Pseudoxanthomonas winnipegensis]
MSIETVAAAMGAGNYAKPLEDACIRFGITTPLQHAHFLAQVAHESDGFATATEYASGRAYEGRADLGNTKPGDGVRFKGRGLIQLTGRANYQAYSLDLYGDDRCVQNPAMVAQLPDAALAAGWFWKTRRLNELADQDNVLKVTRRINGGTNGLDDRTKRLAQAKKLIAALGDR